MVRSVKPSVSHRDWRVSFFLSVGKGVLIPDTLEQAEKEQKEMLGGMFGGASTCTTVCKMDKKTEGIQLGSLCCLFRCDIFVAV